jgi:hypothetical protein
MFHSANPSGADGTISYTKGTNPGPGTLEWSSQWQNDSVTSDAVPGSAIAVDMTGSFFAVRESDGSKALGWWALSEDGTMGWKGLVETED